MNPSFIRCKRISSDVTYPIRINIVRRTIRKSEKNHPCSMTLKVLVPVEVAKRSPLNPQIIILPGAT